MTAVFVPVAARRNHNKRRHHKETLFAEMFKQQTPLFVCKSLHPSSADERHRAFWGLGRGTRGILPPIRMTCRPLKNSAASGQTRSSQKQQTSGQTVTFDKDRRRSAIQRRWWYTLITDIATTDDHQESIQCSSHQCSICRLTFVSRQAPLIQPPNKGEWHPKTRTLSN